MNTKALEKMMSQMLITATKNHAMLQAIAEFQIEVATRTTGISKQKLTARFKELLSRHFERAKNEIQQISEGEE